MGGRMLKSKKNKNKSRKNANNPSEIATKAPKTPIKVHKTSIKAPKTSIEIHDTLSKSPCAYVIEITTSNVSFESHFSIFFFSISHQILEIVRKQDENLILFRSFIPTDIILCAIQGVFTLWSTKTNGFVERK